MPKTARLILREVALADIDAIDRFSVERFGSEVADAYLRGLQATLDKIADYPLSAPKREEFGAGTHCKVYRSHRILYEINESGDAVVLRILHHSRNVSPALNP